MDGRTDISKTICSQNILWGGGGIKSCLLITSGAYIQTHFRIITLEANTMNPDTTAPKVLREHSDLGPHCSIFKCPKEYTLEANTMNPEMGSYCFRGGV